MDMRETGFDALMEDKEPETEEVMKTPEAPKRKPYVVWRVGGEDYKLRLTGDVIDKLETRYRANLLTVLAGDNTPPLNIMLEVIQASMQKYHHGIKQRTVQGLWDEFVDEGGDLTALYTVIMNLLSVSGFFTKAENEELEEQLKDLNA